MSLLLTQRAAAEKLGVSVKLVRRWQRAGRLPTWTDPDSGVVYFPAPALHRWAENAGLLSLSAPNPTGESS
jgi:predicted site-specific integrase-resolvase